MIITKVLKDDGVDILLRREKPSNLLPTGMFLHFPEEGIDYDKIFRKIVELPVQDGKE